MKAGELEVEEVSSTRRQCRIQFPRESKYIVEAASDIITLKTYYSTHPLQGRIWLTADKQIDQERNEALLNWTGKGMEVIRTGETYEQFVARVKDVVANLSPAE